VEGRGDRVSRRREARLGFIVARLSLSTGMSNREHAFGEEER
jgi:hypothetical protein